MFTGIVEEQGEVLSFDGERLVVRAGVVASDASVDDSIAVGGVCLTVVTREEEVLGFDVSPETRERTSLARLAPGTAVNLERPLTLSSRLGGHLVQGHVDGVGSVVSSDAAGAGAVLAIRVSPDLMKYVVEKGSITVDGVSLTVAELGEDIISIAVIPHTMAVTTLGNARAGDQVNIEVDIIAKYVAASRGANQ